MNKFKNIFILVLTLLLVSSVYSIEICGDNPQPNIQCRMVTPTLTCTDYNYTVYNAINGSIVDSGNLTSLADGFYYFNFTQPFGSYQAVLCDDTTREIYVGIKEDNMGWVAIAILIVCMTGFLGWGANMIKDDGLKHIKKILFYLFISNTFMLGIILFIISSNTLQPENFNNLALGYAGVNLFLIFAFTINYTWLIFYRIYEKGKENLRKAWYNGGKIK